MRVIWEQRRSKSFATRMTRCSTVYFMVCELIFVSQYSKRMTEAGGQGKRSVRISSLVGLNLFMYGNGRDTVSRGGRPAEYINEKRMRVWKKEKSL